MYLSWEELPSEEQPPRRIWDDPQRLKEHFAAVRRKRETEMDPNAIKGQPIDDPQQNDAARMLIDDG